MTEAHSWRVADRRFLERSWSGEALIFDEFSGATHYLSRAALAVWSELRRGGPGTLSDLQGRLAARRTEQAPDDEIRVSAVLDELRRLALVQRCES